ncbi:hypothetical protein [Calycomorphotria hydatis]|uniref:Glycosyltransferase RgtA/B/C/D-like domain-containing protein n=1 Tax=Calycomorphotria hydatis TaxID=2528027 RepID=A0A517TBT8_9PLAN|nr:hypothetical protein [Calycomorphotria hydatis]QDT65842.1 hypothetical protein V22_31040 [Calycomorphotria hydatis]
MSREEAATPKLTSIDLIRSAGLVLVLLLAASAAASVLSGRSPFFLFNRQFWLDELISFNMTAVANPIQQIRLLAEGVDLNPPGYYLLMDLWRLVCPLPDEVTVRLFAFLCTVTGTVGTMIALRRFVPASAATAAAIGAVLAHGSVIIQAFDGRYYAPLFAAAGLFAAVLTSPRRSLATEITSGILAASLILIHYFGLFTAVLMTAAYAIGHRRDLLQVKSRLIASCIGIATVLLHIPIIQGQRSAMGDVPTWMGPARYSDLATFFASSYAPWAVFFAAVAGCVAAMLILVFQRDGQLEHSAPEFSLDLITNDALAAFCVTLSMLALPLIVLDFNYMIQPAYAPRYGANTVIGVSAVVALILARTPKPVHCAAVALCFVIGVSTLATSRTRFHPPLFTMERPIEETIAPIREEISAEVPLVAYRYLGYQSWRYGELNADEVYILMPERKREESPLDAHQWQIFDHLAKKGGTPKPISPSKLARMEHFYYLSDGTDRQVNLKEVQDAPFNVQSVPTDDTGLQVAEYIRKK